jgi:hypothetical protein
VRGRRDGGEPPCGRPGIGEIGCRGLRWPVPHMRGAGKLRGRGLLTDDEGEGQRCLECDSRHTRNPHKPFHSEREREGVSVCERERLLLRRVCEGASTDRGCLTPVSLTCSGTREAPVRCPSHWRLRHLPAAPMCGSRRMRGREWRGESCRVAYRCRGQ